MISAWTQLPPAARAVALGAVLLLAQVGLAGYFSHRERALKAEIRQVEVRWQELAEAPLAPTSENLARVREDRHVRQHEVDLLLASLISVKPEIVPQHDRGPEALYFEIVGFVERMRQLADGAGIKLRPEESFGFRQILDAHQVVFPAVAEGLSAQRLIDRLDLQRQYLEVLLGELIAARPLSLRSVEREPVVPVGDGARGLAADLFQLDPTSSVAIPGAIGATGFRFVFTGRSACLRDFLRGVADLNLPVVVRSVEVSPVAVEVPGGGRSPVGRSAGLSADSPFAGFGASPANPSALVVQSVPIIRANESVFTVVVEAYWLVPSAERAASG